MAEPCASTPDQEAITALALDGSMKPVHALSELCILREAAGRWADNMGLDLVGDEVRLGDMFDIIGGTGIGGFYAVLFVSLGMTIGQAIQSHLILQRRLFSSDIWKQVMHEACAETLNIALDEIVLNLGIDRSLDSPFEERNPKTKGFVCVINTVAPTSCRLIRNYRPRTNPGPKCTIRQVLRATLSNRAQLSPIIIEEEYFTSALDGFANPTHVLIKELSNARFRKGTAVACIVNVGVGHTTIQSLNRENILDELAVLLRSCQLVADDIAAQCHDLGSFFFRLAVPSGLHHDTLTSADTVSAVKGLAMGYLLTDEASSRLDDMEESLRDRCGVISLERLNSLAGKDGMSRVSARLAKVEQHLDSTIFRDVNDWLQPIHQTSKLDANIQARDESTCKWLLKNSTFMQWMAEKRGLFWLHGLMGTGKTVLSSFVIQTLCARDDIYVAYYYFEFTNPATLSEEAILRSLVVQLAAASPAVVRAVHQKHNNGGLQPQLESLHTTFNNLISTSSKPVFIIIDALDELPLTQRKYLLRYLATFSASGRVAQIHIMITSREEVDIQRTFEEIADFDLGVQGDLVCQDIAAFVDRQLEAKKWELWPRDEIEMMRHVLNERADGQFRMVACQIDIIQRVNNSKQLREALYSLPKSLSETYDYILRKIPAELRTQAHRLFTTLSFASTSISTVELSVLLAVELGDEEDSEEISGFQETNQFHDPLDVINLGTSLLSRVTDDHCTYLQIAHASVKEYFLAQSDSWFSLCENLAHSTIARCCIALLLNFPISDRSGTHYYYSREYWYTHVLPNGPPQLLLQQQRLYASHSRDYQLRLGAVYGLFDLIENLLNAQPWEPAALAAALVEAARSRRPSSIVLRCCDLLLNAGINVISLKNNMLPLHSASFVGNLEVVRYLVGKGADVNQTDRTEGSPLQAAATTGSLKVVRYLVENGAKVDVNVGGTTALRSGAHWGYLDVVRFLVDKGAAVNPAEEGVDTPLQAGAWSGNMEVVRFLIEKEADLNMVGANYGTALQAAASSGNLELVHFLVEKGARVNVIGGYYGTALQAGVSSGNLHLVRFLVEKGEKVNIVGGYYGTALQAGASKGNLEVVRFLIEKGAKVNIVGGYYGTALQAGASSGNLELVRFLAEKGEMVNTVGGHHGTAVQAGAYKGSLEIVRFLVDIGADVNLFGEPRGITPQLGATSNQNTGIVQPGTALQAAAWTGDLDVVQFLVENGADVNQVGGFYGGLDGGSSRTALDAARDGVPLFGSNTREDIVRYLESHGAKSRDEIFSPGNLVNSGEGVALNSE
ncbi:hypothetical protein DL96DRAFT_1811958 [Flagelloscypha sp. PMI_526]|nr:hypothetical protein DL96DRAFT_1811958 [Flagelloscypha sp. PMI_526]